MYIDGQKAPEKEGYELIIHLCSKCEEFKAENCDVTEYHNQGWCYTFEKILV